MSGGNDSYEEMRRNDIRSQLRDEHRRSDRINKIKDITCVLIAVAGLLAVIFLR